MRTSDTQSISIKAAPGVVLDLVGDPRNLPRWAPAFASEVRPDGEHWLVGSGDAALPIRVRVSRGHGTVDFLARDAEIGAFSRVVPNGEGSDYSFTQLCGPEMDADAVARQKAVVASELETVRALCEERA
jgi:hypothetical protein